VRVAGHNVTVPGPGGETVSELYCLASTLLDHQKFPAEAIREAYPQRWSASETTIGENKTTVTGAGPATGPALRSGEPDLVRQEFWAWLTGAQLVRKSGAASTTAGGARPVTTDQISFTGMRREVNRSMVQTLVATPEASGCAAPAPRRRPRPPRPPGGETPSPAPQPRSGLPACPGPAAAAAQLWPHGDLTPV
jgi:hypothetical protein